jgi:hypothetical protein
MELLVLLLALTLVNVALWRGWGTDSRERDNNWHPSTQDSADRLCPAGTNVGTRDAHVLAH